jgi:monovalent cation:H+ antiporter-2, CPA2 family
VVLVKVAGEAALHTTTYGRTALGISIVQDLVTITLVVVLSAIGSRAEESFESLVLSGAIALGFVALVVVGGSRVLPYLLAAIAGLRSRELFVIGVAVIAIGTAFAAAALGVSVALGAFVAGLALADSDLTASVLGEIVPLRELFSTFFFVSIGVLLQPVAILEAWPIVVALLLIITFGKAVPAAILARLDGQRPSSALRAGALVGQSGEFSFVLASTGLTLGAVRPDTFSLAMGAVVISILTAGPLLAGARRLGDWLDSRTGYPALPGDEPGAGMRRHAVILGYGRVGRSVARVLESRGFAWVAVDGDYAIAREARIAGAPIIYGEAGTQSVLDQARVKDAHALVVAMPDALATRQAIAYARARNPRVEVVARAHSEAEEAELRQLGAMRVVVAERELGNQLVRHALRRFGVSDREVAAILDARRGGGEAQASPIRSTSSSSELMVRAGRTPPGSSWMTPHGPRRSQMARMPAAAAGMTSLSTRSPTYATDPGSGLPISSRQRSKNAGCGFATPSVSLIAITSTSTPIARSSADRDAGWLATTATS